MDIYYRILSVDPAEHSMVVRYWSDAVPEYTLACEMNPDGSPKLTNDGYPVRCRTDYNITVYQTPSPSEEELINLIINNAPIQWLVVKEDIKSNFVDTSLSAILDKVKEKRKFTVDIPRNNSISDYE